MTQRYDDQMRITELSHFAVQRRGDPRPRRLWKIAAPLIFGVGTGGWLERILVLCGIARQPRVSAEWLQREAQAGRAFACATIRMSAATCSVSEVLQVLTSSELRNLTPEPDAVWESSPLPLAQVYDPTLLIGEFTGPTHDVGNSCAFESVSAFR